MKKLIIGICTVAIIVLATINVSFSLKNENIIDIKLANVLALATNENNWLSNECRTEETTRRFGSGGGIYIVCIITSRKCVPWPGIQCQEGATYYWLADNTTTGGFTDYNCTGR